MPYSYLTPNRLRLEDESTGTGYLFIQKDGEFLWCDASANILQVLSCVKFGTKADRPTAGKKGRLYFTTDTKELFYDNGSAWVRVVSGEVGLYDADRDTYINVEPSSDADKIVGYTAGNQVLNISSAGILTFVKQSACHVKLSAQQNITANSETIINFDTIVFDNQNEFDTTNHRFTASEAGKYLIILQVRMVDTTQTGWGGVVRIYKNGSLSNEAVLLHDDLTDHNRGYGNCNSVISLENGDYVEAKIYCDIDHTVRANGTWLNIVKLL